MKKIGLLVLSFLASLCACAGFTACNTDSRGGANAPHVYCLTLLYRINESDMTAHTIEIYCDIGDVVTVPEVPEVEGYTFEPWIVGENGEYSFMPGESFTVTADMFSEGIDGGHHPKGFYSWNDDDEFFKQINYWDLDDSYEGNVIIHHSNSNGGYYSRAEYVANIHLFDNEFEFDQFNVELYNVYRNACSQVLQYVNGFYDGNGMGGYSLEDPRLENIFCGEYRFEGLYLDEDYQIPFTKEKKVLNNLEIYTKWEFTGLKFSPVAGYQFWRLESINNTEDIGSLEIPSEVNYLPVAEISISDWGDPSIFGTIQKLILPNTIEYISYSSFPANARVLEIVVGDDTEIYQHAFWYSNPNLKVTFSNNDPQYYYQDGIIYNLKQSSVHSIVGLYSQGALNDIVIPEFIADIGNIFAGTKVTSIQLPNSTTSIGEGAFKNCTELKTIVMPNVTTIGKNAFSGCTSIESVDMANVTTVEESAFSNCTGLKTIVLPNVTTVNKTAFSGCSALGSVDMANVTTVGESAFSNCTGLKTIVTPNVTTIGKNAFSGCTALASIDMAKITTVEEGVFSGCTELKTIVTPNVTKINKNAFIGCTALASIDMANVTTVGESAFSNCTGLKTIVLPSVKTIGKSAFSGCSALESLRMAGAMETIEAYAFKDCASLDFLLLNSLSYVVLTIADNAFSGCGPIDEIYYGNDSSAWDSISGTKPEGTVYFYSKYEQTVENYMYFKTLTWHYDENGDPEFWIHINDTLSGKRLTSTKGNARVILTEYTWEQLYGAKQNGLLAMMPEGDLRTAIENAETKADLDEYFTSHLNVVDATLVFGTDGTVTVYNGKFPEGYKYEYIEMNDRLILTDPKGVETLLGEFYFDTDGHLYEIQPFSVEGMEGYDNSDEGFANVRFDYYPEVIETN